MRRYTGVAKPLLAGFSFGAMVALRVGCADPEILGLIGVGLAPRLFDPRGC